MTARPPIAAAAAPPRRVAAGAALVVAWLVLLAGALVGLVAIGHGSLGAPPLTGASALRAWADQRDPASALMAGLRVVALALGGYLFTVTAVGAALRLVRAGRLVQLADLITLPSVRRLLNGALGVSLVASTITATAGLAGATGRAPAVPADAPTMQQVADDPPTSPPVTMHRVPDPQVPATTTAPATLSTTSTAMGHGADTPSMSVVSPGGGATPGDAGRPDAPATAGNRQPTTAAGDVPTQARVDAPDAASDGPSGAAPGDAGDATGAAAGIAPAPAAPTSADPASSAGPAASTWVVQPGDSFWRIAAASVERATGHRPTDAEIDRYWRRLIDANRSALVDGSNPDLILPTQVFTLPPL